jgi:hypothetical protein
MVINVTDWMSAIVEVGGWVMYTEHTLPENNMGA